MKKEYMKPEAEMMKFAEVEEIMTGSITGIPGLGGDFGVTDELPEGWN